MKSILLIDDDKFVTTLYAAKLQSEGFAVDTAHSGNEAIEKLEKNRPDMIILDLNMPGISGVELLRAIRAVPLFQHVPVIIFSSAYIRTLVDEATQLGVNKILAKSQCPPKMLISEVKKILDRVPAMSHAVASTRTLGRNTVCAADVYSDPMRRLREKP